MFIKFILLCTIAIIGVKAIDEPSSVSTAIKELAHRWAESHKQYLSSTPYETVRKSAITRCHIVQECCSNQRDRLFNILHERKLEQTCIGTQGSKLYNSHSEKCQSLIQDYNNIQKSTEYVDFLRVQANAGIKTRWPDWLSKMAKVCSAAELTAYFCEPENMVPFQSCTEKVIRQVDCKNGEADCVTFVRDLKKDYDTLHQKYS